MEKSKILVTYAGDYELKSDDGRDVKGCIVQYFFFGQNGELLQAQNELNGPVGYQRAKCSCDISLRNKIKVAPAIYEAEFSMNVGADGKPILKISDLEYVGNVDIKAANVTKK